MDDTARFVLLDYWRSSASYRVRIALNLLGLPWQAQPVDLLGGAHRDAAYLARNPQGLVPTLSVDGVDLGQSLAIIEYLDETVPGATLLPDDPLARHRVRSLSYAVAMEIHPICNLSVARHAADTSGGGEAAMVDWMQHFIGQGLARLEAMLERGGPGRFCHGDTPGMADCCLVPQLYNARRWGVDHAMHDRICAIEDACTVLEPFAAAHPDRIGAP